ncbi:hypothetical protein SELMODRAFT_172615 [Selaginella moellendorffii]|uniref:CDK5RAP3-like protein n=1 Tax=Selaginella moellendorffii TaxID=88036 RepID=D8RM96_SELML|nr:CDK5RAP3-like protein [Selaginella moellendorffii]EFJ26499.1 hypothetical protein SELMODRAFT_172615 [Selaginella moellendorffii]|eukprot:XP_002972413.1 CDK5RAP3-like protein [Selaginella moellendorffii]
MDGSRELPIDIAYAKLADWLVDRRWMHGEWRKKLAQIRARIAPAFARLPKQGDPWLLSLSPESVGYLEARRIRDIALSTSAAQPDKGVFARLATSGPGREWDAIVHAYEKDNLYLGEAAQLMLHNVNYDIPFVKKQIARLQQQLADLERKEAEFKRNALASASKYQHACRELGIAGVNVRSELLASVSSLPGILSTLKDILCRRRVDDAVHLYEVYASYAHTYAQVQGSVLLAALKDVRDTPLDVGTDFPPHDNTDPAAGVPGAQGIQCDQLPEAATQLETDEIQWDIDLADTRLVESKCDDDEESAGIVWDIDVEQGAEGHEDPLGFEKAGSAVQGYGSSLAPFCRLVDSQYRNNLLSDLLEVRAFLVQRVEELDNSATAALQSQIQAVASASLPQYSSQVLKEMGGDISVALDLVTSSRTRDLVLMLTSERFVDRLEASLKEKKQSEAKCLNSLRDVEHKKVELRNALSSSWPKQEELVSKTRELKRSVEEALSRLYSGRLVNIIGEINVVV